MRRVHPLRGGSRVLALAACVALVPGLAFPAGPAPQGDDAAPPPVDPAPRGDAALPPIERASTDSRPLGAVLGAETGGFDFSGILSLEIPSSKFDVGPRLSGEVMYGAFDLTPQLRFLVGARASFAYHSATGGSMWLLEAVPDLKLRYALTRQLGVYGDFGLGLSFQHRSSDFAGGSDDSIPLTIQFGFGGTLALTDDLALVSELRIATYTKSGSPVFIAVPTVGLVFRAF